MANALARSRGTNAQALDAAAARWARADSVTPESMYNDFDIDI